MDPIALANAGGWAVVVAILMAIGVGVVKGYAVPRFVYDREVLRADVLASELSKNTEALNQLTEALRFDRAVREKPDG
jgi:hypothetical protein